jgi:hypothetical protein
LVVTSSSPMGSWSSSFGSPDEEDESDCGPNFGGSGSG